jgi:hypothetical protein
MGPEKLARSFNLPDRQLLGDKTLAQTESVIAAPCHTTPRSFGRLLVQTADPKLAISLRNEIGSAGQGCSNVP